MYSPYFTSNKTGVCANAKKNCEVTNSKIFKEFGEGHGYRTPATYSSLRTQKYPVMVQQLLFYLQWTGRDNDCDGVIDNHLPLGTLTLKFC